MEIRQLKTQLEVRYTHILDFSTSIKPLLSPFLKLAHGFNLNNQGRLDEGYKLNFETDRFSVEARWDRIILIIEGDLARFEEETSSLSVFFDIVDAIKNLSSFGTITNCVFLTYFFEAQQKEKAEVVKSFNDTYFKHEVQNILNAPTNLSFELAKEIEDKESISITLNPFSSYEIENKNLLPFGSEDSLKLYDEEGVLMSVKIFRKNNNFVFKDFIKLKKETREYSKKL